LIVDENSVDRESWASRLEEEGYRVDTAGSRRKAEELLQRATYTVALLDQRLPDDAGMELLQAIRHTSPETVCFVTSDAISAQAHERALDLGGYDYLVKPIDPEKLVDILRQAFGR
jgi:two-component system OmpR family response regulator